jgi:uncharacterized protein (DUF305 family)
MKTSLVLAAALACGAPAVAFAQQTDSKAAAGASSGMHQHMMKGSQESMRMKPSGDIDRDFATMMRHHHQTGIRMAQEEVKNGKDPKMKELAQKIVDGQQQETQQLDQWLAERKGSDGSAARGSSADRPHGTPQSK